MEKNFERIVGDAGICPWKPVSEGSQIPVSMVLKLL